LRQGILLKPRRHHNNKGYRQIKRGKTREQVKRLAKKLGLPYNSDDKNNVEIEMEPKFYTVGGCVRDPLMGKLAHDIDYVVVGATPEWMIQKGYKQVGADFPVFLNEKGEEFALARTERKTGDGYHGFETVFDPSISLKDDLFRRDLTVNAMAKDMETGEIIDPFGGQVDIKAKRLKHVSEAFREDPVRVLRLARFVAKFAGDWSVDDSTVALCKEMVANGELNHLTKERIWKEFERALHDIFAPEKFLATLKNCNALGAVFPMLDKKFDLIHATLLDHTYHTPTPWKRTCRNIFNFAIIMQHFKEEDVKEFCATYKIPNEYVDYAIKHLRVNSFDIHSSAADYVQFLQTNGFYQHSDVTIAHKFGKSIRSRYLDKALALTTDIKFDDIPASIVGTLVGKQISDYINMMRAEKLDELL